MNKISVIIPIYNSEKGLRKCLDSVINQTYENLEIILINDGSKDRSRNICEEYKQKDNRIILINQENSGPAKTRNCGLKLATGEYIAFIDSDDYIDEKMFEKLIFRIIDDNSDIAICKHVEVINNAVIHMNYKNLSPTILNEDIIKLFLKGNTINAYLWNKLYRKELFKNLEFNDIKMLEDLDIMYKLLRKSQKISFVNEELYYYKCDNDSSLSKRCSIQMINDYCYAIDEMYKELGKISNIECEINFNKVIMYIPLFSNIAQSDYYNNDTKFNNLYFDFKLSFKYVISHKMLKDLNKKQISKGLLLFCSKKLFYNIYRKKMKK